MKQKQLTLGMFGFGCVGQGLFDSLEQTKGIKATIKTICVKDRNKQRREGMDCFTYNKEDILNDAEIDIVVELIDDADAAFKIVSTAMKAGKGVVTANKKMVAEHFEELFQLQKEMDVPFLYEASSCASIPVIRNLEEYYDNDLLSAIEGVFNGSSNYILTQVFQKGKAYDEALKEAQELGFAESDPTLDVGGFDAKYKLNILTAHAFGVFLKPEQIFNYGIQTLTEQDYKVAREKGYKIKQVATANKVGNHLCAFVMPQMVGKKDKLYQVEEEYNAVVLKGAFADEQFFVGKGAGSFPTGSAVLSDVSALTYNYRYEYKKYYQEDRPVFTNDILIEVYVRYKREEDIHDLHFLQVHEDYKSKGVNYKTGTVLLSQLMESTVVTHPDVFIARTSEKEIGIKEATSNQQAATVTAG